MNHVNPRRAGVSYLVVLLLLGVLPCGVPAAAIAAGGVRVPTGRWEVQVTDNSKAQYFRGPRTYIFGITLKEGATGSTTASLEYQGTAITDGSLKGKQHVKAVISRPISNATFDGKKLLLFAAGDFKLTTAEPPGHTIKEYATLGGLLPEVIINKLTESFYGVMVFTFDGENLVYAGKDASAGKKIVWKKVR